MTSTSLVHKSKSSREEAGPERIAHRPFFFCLMLLAFGVSCGQGTKPDWLIEPGVRVGPITATSSEADLRKSFGADAVKAKDVDIGEGVTEPGTVIYEGSPEKTLAILWKDKSRTRPDRVIICYGEIVSKCLWQTADGLGMGMTLKELETRNGKPFELLGFGWDYTGNITSWHDGKLAKIGMAMMVHPDADAENALPDDEKMAVMGDQVLQSSHPVVQKLNPTVYSLQFVFSK